MKRFRSKLLVAVIAALATAVTAWAFYSTAGAGDGDVTVGSFTPATISVPAASTGTHAVSWTAQASLSDTSKNSQIKYVVQRKLDSGSFADVPSGPCSGELSHGTTSCSDTVTASGSYTYRVIAKYSGWTATSNEAGAVVVTLGGAVAPAQPTSVALANGGGVGNAYINGANKSSVNVTVGLGTTSLATDTVHVTITDGTNTTTDKTVAATTGSGTVTVTGIDASSLNDGSVTLRATSSNAAGTSPERTAAVTKDATLPESSASSPQYATTAPITVTYTATDGTGSGVKEVELWARKAGGTFALVETDTDPSSASFSFTPSAGEGTYEFYTRARDTAANHEAAPAAADDSTIYDLTAPSSTASSPANAGTTPITVTYTATDTGGSGVKEVELWARRGTSGGFSLVATDTDPSTPSFSYFPTGGNGTYQFYTRARDNATNFEAAPATRDSQTVLNDATRPRAVDVQATNGGSTPGKLEAGDQIIITFDEAVLSTSIRSSWNDPTTSLTNQTVAFKNNSDKDEIEQLNNPDIGLIKTNGDYVSANANFASSTLTLSADRKTLTVTLGGSPSNINATAVGAKTMDYTPDADIDDVVGNAIDTATAIETGASDVDF